MNAFSMGTMSEHRSDLSASSGTTVAGAICFLSAGLFYLLAEALAASVFPGYSYAVNYISDLGVPDVEILGGRAVDSPLHPLITVAFAAQGLLFAVGAALLCRRFRLPLRGAFVVLAFAHALGMVTVAVVHGGQANIERGLDTDHVLGAAAAFLGGNAAAIIAGISLLRAGSHRRLGGWSIALGAVGLFGMLMLQVDVRFLPATLLEDGVWERMTFYAILAWEMLVGTLVLRYAGAQRWRHADASR